MGDRVLIKCTACAAKFSIRDRIKLGKKIRCPKCAEIFVARPVQRKAKRKQPDSAEAADEDYFSEGGNPAGAATPRRLPPRRSKKVARRKTASEKSSGAGMPLLLVGSVVAVVAIGVTVYLVSNRPDEAAPQATTDVTNSQSAPQADVRQSLQESPAGGTTITPPQVNTQVAAAPTPQTPSRSKKAIKYGETEEVVATNSESFPQGVSQVTGRTRWFWTRMLDASGTEQSIIELYVDIRGDITSQAISVGKAKITKLKLTPTQDLVPFKAAGNQFDIESRYYDIGDWEQPAGAVRMALPFVAPGQHAETVAEVEGFITVKAAQLLEEITIPDVRSAANKPLQSPVLQKAKAELLMTQQRFQGNSVDVLHFRHAPGFSPGPLEITSSTFSVSLNRDLQIDPNGLHYSSRHLGNLPHGKLSMTFKLYGETQDIVVPFRFESLPLPELQKRPN